MPTSTSPSGHAPAVRREAPDGEAYRRAMGRFPTGVAILTQGADR